jgi:hypothetical protein
MEPHARLSQRKGGQSSLRGRCILCVQHGECRELVSAVIRYTYGIERCGEEKKAKERIAQKAHHHVGL